ncbi:prepilin-type N-terminal cleavage/methylation domain-containing protein [Verrucomicrobiota bacterium]
MATRGKKKSSGMTLIEVMLAIMILGVGLTVLLTAASRCLAVLKLSKNYQTAQWVLGMGQLEYPLVATNELDELEVDSVDYDGFKFSREVEEEEEGEEEDGLHVVRTRVTWSDRRGKFSEEIVQYVLKMDEDK